MSDIFDKFANAPRLEWERPPAEASRRAKRRPEGVPIPAPAEDSPRRVVGPDDVRATRVDETLEGMISQSLPRVDVTLLLQPPAGDGLWTLQGRAWFEVAKSERVRVALVQSDHVIDETDLRSGDSFRFQDVLLRDWTLEFHFADGEVVVFRHQSG